MRLSLLQKVDNAHDDSVWTVAWANGSNVLATGSVDEAVKLWRQEGDTLVELHRLSGVSLGAVSVAMDSTGSYGAVSSLDGSINVWKMDGDFPPVGAGIKQNPSETWGLAFLPRESSDNTAKLAVAGGSSNTVKIVEAIKGDVLATLEVPAASDQDDVSGTRSKRERFVLSVAISPNGQRLAAGAMDGTVAVFDLATSKLLHSLQGCDDMHVHLYDADHGNLIEAFSGHESWVLSIAVHPDGSAFATGGSDGKVKLWDLNTRSCVQTLSDHSDQVWGVAFTQDGSRLASVSDDRSVCLFSFS